MKWGKILLVVSMLIYSAGFGQPVYAPNWESIDSRPIPKWFTDAKFGIFIHWGVYSVPAWAPVGKEYGASPIYSEWYWCRLLTDSSKIGKAARDYHNKTYGPNFRYPDFAPMFKAELFQPAQWAELFAGSGARYVVLTSKHHEGFTLWPSAESWNWNAVDIGPHRDLAGDLMKAVKAKGLRMGYYYSLYEWFNPLYRSDVGKYVDQHMIPQIKDLVTRYKPDILWTDGEWEHPSETWKSTEFLSWLYNESTVKNEVVVNDRWGKETRSKHGGFYTTEYDLVDDKGRDLKINRPWEECRGIGGSFGFNRNESLSDYESSESLVHMLIEKVAHGGNLLLDIGPAADGSIPVIMQQRLMDIGRWLKINGEAIYETSPREGMIKKQDNIFYTQKGKDLYILCTKYPAAQIVVEHIKKPESISILGSSIPVQSKYKNGKLILTPPVIKTSEDESRYAWVFKLKAAL
jgi:alpha-L-fucosidase